MYSLFTSSMPQLYKQTERRRGQRGGRGKGGGRRKELTEKGEEGRGGGGERDSNSNEI